MCRQYSEPARADYDTEEEYQEALDDYDYEMMCREDYYKEKRLDRVYNIN